MAGARGNRPAGPFSFNADSPQAVGLKAWFPQRAQGSPSDYLSGMTLTGQVDYSSSQLGIGALFDSLGAGAETTTPDRLKLGLPISLAAWIVPVGAPSANAGIFGVVYASSGASPYLAYNLDYDASGNYRLDGNSAGSFHQLEPGIAPTAFLPTLLVGTISATARVLYINGVAVGSASGVSDPTYDTTSVLVMGTAASDRNSNFVFIDGKIWNRELTATEVWSLYDPATRWDLYWVPSRRVFFDIVAAASVNRRRRVLMSA